MRKARQNTSEIAPGKTPSYSASGEIVKTLLIQRRVTLKALADSIGFDVGNVSGVIAGRVQSWPIKHALNRYFRQKLFFRPASSSNRNPKPMTLC